MTLFVSRHLWPDLPKLHRHARQHGVWLTDRGEVILDGEGVGTYELAGSALVFTTSTTRARWSRSSIFGRSSDRRSLTPSVVSRR